MVVVCKLCKFHSKIKAVGSVAVLETALVAMHHTAVGQERTHGHFWPGQPARPASDMVRLVSSSGAVSRRFRLKKVSRRRDVDPSPPDTGILLSE